MSISKHKIDYGGKQRRYVILQSYTPLYTPSQQNQCPVFHILSLEIRFAACHRPNGEQMETTDMLEEGYKTPNCLLLLH